MFYFNMEPRQKWKESDNTVALELEDEVKHKNISFVVVNHTRQSLIIINALTRI